MTTVIFLIVLAIAGYYFWKEYGSLRHLKRRREENTPAHRQQALIDLVNKATIHLTIVDFRTEPDSGLYNNVDVLNTVKQRRKEQPELEIEYATAFTQKTALSRWLEDQPNTLVRRGKAEAQGLRMFAIADAGRYAYTVGPWGRHAVAYDCSDGLGQRPINMLLGNELDIAQAIFHEIIEPTERTTVRTGPGGRQVSA